MRPEFLTDFVPGDELTGPLQQQGKNLQRLRLQTNPDPRLGELAFLEINLEGPKTNNPASRLTLHVECSTPQDFSMAGQKSE